MKSFRYLVIILCLLMYCEIYAQGKVEKDLITSGEAWNNMDEIDRGLYLIGLRDGIMEGKVESYRLTRILKEKDYILLIDGL